MGNQLVLGFFKNEAAADGAVNQIKGWDKASKDVKLGAIGVLVKDEKGNIKTHKLGARKTKTGALLFALVGLFSGGMTVLGGVGFLDMTLIPLIGTYLVPMVIGGLVLGAGFVIGGY